VTRPCYACRVRRLVIAIVLLGLGGPVAADAGSSAPVPTEAARPPKKPTELMRERQQLEEAGEGGRSGFWTSRRPAQGGAYRWRLLLIGLALIGIMGGSILLLIKRANRANPTRGKSAPRPWDPKPADPKPTDEMPIASKPADAA